MKIINNKPKSIKPEFKNRHEARELALQFLYSLDSNSRGGENPQKFETSLELFLGEGGIAENATPEVKDYTRFLAQGAWNARTEADEILFHVISGWRPDRLNIVDRAVLRLMIFEGFLAKNLPEKSAIAEAVNIAGVFGSDRSPRFIHGVLAKVSKYMLSREVFGDDKNGSEDENNLINNENE